MRPPVACILATLLGLTAGGAVRWMVYGGDGEKSGEAAPVPAALSTPGIGSGGNGKKTAAARLEARSAPEDFLAMRGWEQAELVAAWIATASAAECRDFLLQWRNADDGDDTVIKDAAFLRWVELDAAEAVAFSEANGYSNIAWWAWGKLDPERALAAAAEKKETWLGKAALRGIAQADPQRALELMQRYPQFEDTTSLEGLVSGLSRTDPSAAADIALRLDSSETRNVIKGWAKREPDAALAWARDIESPGQRRSMMRAILEQWQDTNPERIPDLLAGLPAGGLKTEMLSNHVSAFARRDAAGAIAFAKQIEAPATRNAVLGAAYESLAAVQPQAALELIRAEPWDRTIAMQMQGALAELGGSLPEETMAFLNTKAGDDFARGLRGQVFAAWVGKDMREASGWLAAQPAEQRQEPDVRWLASHLSQPGPDCDYDAAVRWALSMPALRDDGNFMNSTLSAWYRADAAAALQAVELPGIPPPAREALLRLHVHSTSP